MIRYRVDLTEPEQRCDGWWFAILTLDEDKTRGPFADELEARAAQNAVLRDALAWAKRKGGDAVLTHARTLWLELPEDVAFRGLPWSSQAVSDHRGRGPR